MNLFTGEVFSKCPWQYCSTVNYLLFLNYGFDARLNLSLMISPNLEASQSQKSSFPGELPLVSLPQLDNSS